MHYNSPVVLGFSLLCLLALWLNYVTGGLANNLLFSVYQSPWSNPFTYLRLFGHVVGHADWSHLTSNVMLILIIGPLLEEKYGSRDLLFMILFTALITGLAHFFLFPGTQLLGASGIVFAMIVAASMTGIKDGSIPVTFILVFLIYIGQEIYSALYVADNVSQFTHIIGGIVGALFGYIIHKHANK